MSNQCKESVCSKPIKARGYCGAHYEYRRLHGMLDNVKQSIRHGMRHTKEYSCWSHIKDRCMNVNDAAYDRYGGRGISVCDEWITDFMAFYRHIGPAPSEKHSIDRIDNNLGYAPGNVRWANDETQSNNRRNVDVVDFSGKAGSLAQHCRWLGLNYETLKWRRRTSGWTTMQTLRHYTEGTT